MLKIMQGRFLYVIHKHQASHLHYDLRLEHEGVLKSWAIPRGPSMDPSQKRLAVEVEDHPLDYARFEGNIPEGEYGAGGVIIWDRGTYRAAAEGGGMGEMLKNGSIRVIMEGEKLKGGFHLFKTRWKGSRNSWLLVKENDEWARRGGDITMLEPRSVVSGRDVTDL